MLRKPILILKFWCGIAALNPSDIHECMGDLTCDEVWGGGGLGFLKTTKKPLNLFWNILFSSWNLQI